MSELIKMIGRLKELGLTEYEARVYLTLVTKGSLQGGELALNSGVPRTKVYESVRGLIKKKLVEAYGRPRKFSAVSSPEPFDVIIEQEERKFRELKSLINEIKSMSQKTGVSSVKGSFQIINGGGIESVVNDMLSKTKDKITLIVNSNTFWIVKKYERQLMSMRLSEVKVNAIVSPKDSELVNDASTSLLPVLVGNTIDGRSAIVSDDRYLLLINEDSGTGVLVMLPQLISLIDKYIVDPLISSSIDIKSYIRLINTGSAEDFLNLKNDRSIFEILSQAVFDLLPEDSLWQIGDQMVEIFKTNVPAQFVTSEFSLAIPIFIELISSDIKDGTVKYDELTKIINIEYRGKNGKLPNSPWLLMLKGYLKSIGRDMQVVGRFQVEDKTIIQIRLPWEIQTITL
ncbi:MAG: TrmB family transcriptional regulator [Nitrososphaeria archaeon]